MIQVVSASKIKCWKECRKKYFFRYIENLRSQIVGTALRFGSAVHAGLDLILGRRIGDLEEVMLTAYKRDMTQISPEDEIELQKAKIAVESWIERDPLHLLSSTPDVSVIATESRFEKSIGYARRVLGFFDGLISVKGDIWILEHKTTSRIDASYFENLLKDEQATMYIVGAKLLFPDLEIKGVLYNIIQKPSIRIKKSETPSEYLERVEEWYAVENRFTIHRVSRTREQLAEFENDLKKTMCDIRRAERDGSFYRSPGNCAATFFGCEFSSICLEDTPEAREGLFTQYHKE